MVEAECGGVRPKAYADDASGRANGSRPIFDMISKTVEFSKLTRMRLNLKKCSLWATNPGLRDELKRMAEQMFPDKEQRPKVVLNERQLGAQLSFSGRSVGSKDVQRRHDQAAEACTRIGSLPLSPEQRSHLVGSVVTPKLNYDSSVNPMSKKMCQKWRTRVSRAVLGDGCATRCNEALFNLFTKGHQVDPWQAQIYESVLTTREQLRKYPDLREQFVRCCALRQVQGSPKVWAGPAGQFLSRIRKMGWNWEVFFSFRT